MSGTGSARQTGSVTVATGTTIVTRSLAPARNGHLATRTSSGIRMVGAPIGCCDVRVLDRAETNYLAPHRAVAAGRVSGRRAICPVSESRPAAASGDSCGIRGNARGTAGGNARGSAHGGTGAGS